METKPGEHRQSLHRRPRTTIALHPANLADPWQSVNAMVPLLGVSRQFVDKLIGDGRLAAQLKPGSRHRVVRVSDVLELEASRRAGADRIAATIDTPAPCTDGSSHGLMLVFVDTTA